MLTREEILGVLEEAQQVDRECRLFGASTHRYRLNPPLERSFVQAAEERYGIRLPEEYARFLTEAGDGGAGPDYGIRSFRESVLFLEGQRPTKASAAYLAACRRSLARPFTPRPMAAGEVEEYAIVTREGYTRHPERYFVLESFDDDITDGFLVLGTHGCQWDFGIVLSGERRGQIFDLDNEGGYGFAAESFESFYRGWLERLADREWLLKQLRRRQ